MDLMNDGGERINYGENSAIREPSEGKGRPDLISPFGTPCRETFLMSLCCESEYTETWKCEECGEYISGAYIKSARDDRICENCYTIFEIGGE